MSATLVLAFALVPLVALRPLMAAVEVMIASGGGQRRWPSDALLASTARATAHIAGATVVGIVTTLVWWHAGRGVVPLVLLVLVPAMLVLLDLVPRGLMVESGARPRPVLEVLLGGLTVALAPVLLLERALGALFGRRGQVATLVELKRLGSWLAVRPRRGALDISEAGLVARIRRFTGKTARDVMVSLVDACAVTDTTSVGEVIALVRERGFSRIPVFRERMFNTIGIVTSLDLLGSVARSVPVTAIMREPLFVPESVALPELLATLQAEGRNIGIVVDEYGGAVGLVTVEDVVEEIVGEIEDEYDAPRDLFRRVAPGIYSVSARAPVAEVNERFGWNLPQGEYETIGGLVLERLGRVPKPGDAVRAGRVEIVVSRASARAVQELRVQEQRLLRR